MFSIKYLFYIIFLQLINGAPQINLYFTDMGNQIENSDVLQHDCLYLTNQHASSNDEHRALPFCMGESSVKFNVQKNNIFPNFTFDELVKRNITSQQLYLWSAPIDTIESYQSYINQDNLSLSRKVFYNCTLPRFGPQCQYQFDHHHSEHMSLDDIINDFYINNKYQPTGLTCYIHLQCDRSPDMGCLDWTEICDGKIDCLNNGIDEEQCWQLEINECKSNEYRCYNGQCIPRSFIKDSHNVVIHDCIDDSDENLAHTQLYHRCFYLTDPYMECEETVCRNTFLTSSCLKQRYELIVETLFSKKDDNISNDCWLAFKCLFHIPNTICDRFGESRECITMIETTCPNRINVPFVPILFGDIYVAYIKNKSQNLNQPNYLYLYICTNNSIYDDYFVHSSKILINNAICYQNITWNLNQSSDYRHELFKYQYGPLHKYNRFLNYSSTICDRPNMYRCIKSSKCISIHRLLDTIYDCPYFDDEDENIIKNISLTEQYKNNRFKCSKSNKYILQLWFMNYRCDCGYDQNNTCEDEDLFVHNRLEDHLFTEMCDGYVDLLPMLIDGRYESDETECDQWECNNTYTRCNHEWSCINGEDEVDCYSSTLNCSSNHLVCNSPYINELMCLPTEKVNDGNIDCHGGWDETKLCRRKPSIMNQNAFLCVNDTVEECIDYTKVCDNHADCLHEDDEKFCSNNNLMKNSNYSSTSFFISHESDSEESYSTKNLFNKSLVFHKTIIKTSVTYQSHCHRGIDLRVWLNDINNSTITCLCPPNYYGDKCQYQNQRVTLNIQFNPSYSSFTIPFAIVVSLIDDDYARIIHSYEQFTFLNSWSCDGKYYIPLVYSKRPKNETKRYSIHIDVYEKLSLGYRGSFLIPINFTFLPVHHLALKINIPRNNRSVTGCSKYQCIHGRCIRYLNSPNDVTFCQCDQGWSGRYCNIQRLCMCSHDALCIGVTTQNRSVCVCPLHRSGPHCLIRDSSCQINTNLSCLNGGQCMPLDKYTRKGGVFFCLCPKGFNGQRCEDVDYKMILSFEKDIILSQSILIHTVTIIYNQYIVKDTIFKTIPTNRDSIIIYRVTSFDHVFVEFSKTNYYLATLKHSQTDTKNITKTVNSSNRCPYINEIVNETMFRLHFIRRIKYYHLICQKHSPSLLCFYDVHQLCLCYDYGHKRQANCFIHNHNKTFDCEDQNDCGYRGQCFEGSPISCVQTKWCQCRPCFFGPDCQLSTSGFGLSLDAILGYHIQPYIKLTHQPTIVQISAALNIIFVVTGLINGILSLITFKNKSVREVGCGLYLLCSSITTLLLTIMFGLKYWILILAQMSSITNQLFLLIQCHLFDFLLRNCLSMDQWLNACVATERAACAIQGTRFNKKKSKQTAKLIIIIIIIINIGTSIQDPVYRQLTDEDNDENEKRIWCIINYPSTDLSVYDNVMNTFHFFVPFLLNIISSVILITKKSRQQSNVQTHHTFKSLFRKQFLEHKHLFIGPIVLVILAIPRLIISYASTCLQSGKNTWLYLAGYFISYIPPMLTFTIFILPSKFYKKEFRKSVQEYQSKFRRRFHLTV